MPQKIFHLKGFENLNWIWQSSKHENSFLQPIRLKTFSLSCTGQHFYNYGDGNNDQSEDNWQLIWLRGKSEICFTTVVGLGATWWWALGWVVDLVTWLLAPTSTLNGFAMGVTRGSNLWLFTGSRPREISSKWIWARVDIFASITYLFWF